MSAAHCFDNRNASMYYVKLGEHNLKIHSKYEQKRQAVEVHVHPNYNKENQDYDLALIKLEKKVQLNERVRTACLPGAKIQFPIGTMCQAQVPLTSHDECTKAYKKLDYDV